MTHHGSNYGQFPYQVPPPGAPQPPVIPFWPLDLGRLFSGSFAAVKQNAGPMFKISLGASAVIGLISGASAAAFASFSIDPDFWFEVDTEVTFDSAWSAIGGTAAEVAASLIAALLMLFVSAILVLSAVNSVIGSNLSVSSLWGKLAPNGWRLIGAALLVWLIVGLGGALAIFGVMALMVLFIVVTDTVIWPWVILMTLAVLGGITLIIWGSVRLYFSTSVVAVEGAGPVEALRRSWRLTKGAFWRVFGRYLLVSILAGTILSLVIGIVSAIMVALTALAGVPAAFSTFLIAFFSSLLAGVVLPYTSSYSALMYTDERIRKENLAPALAEAFLENSQRASQ